MHKKIRRTLQCMLLRERSQSEEEVLCCVFLCAAGWRKANLARQQLPEVSKRGVAQEGLRAVRIVNTIYNTHILRM